MEPDQNQLWDALIIGAGPAGAEMAYQLASAGLQVAVLEQDHLAREKPCGGGIQLQELIEFGPLPDSVIERKITRIRMISPEGKVLDAGMAADGQYSVTVRRSLYDRFLQQRAEETGAIFFPETKAVRIEYPQQRIHIRAQSGDQVRTFKGRLLVNAAGSGARRLLRDKCVSTEEEDKAITFHCWVRIKNIERHFSDAIELYYLKEIPEGYVWIFPKKDLLSIGIGATAKTMKRDRLNLKKLLFEFMTHHPVASRKLKGFQIEREFGGVVPFSIPAKLYETSTVLLGDAAGLANLVHGGGIYHARKSAKLAAPFCLRFIKDGRQEHLTQYDRLARDFFDQYEKIWDRKIRCILWRPGVVEPVVEKGKTDDDIKEAIRIILTSTESHERAYRIFESKMLKIIYSELDAKANLYRKTLNTKLKRIFTREAALHGYANEILLNNDAKRLRACLGVLAADLFNGNLNDAMNFSLIYEIFHTASLVHDDIMDESPKRRNRPTLHTKYGMANAIITGDLMLAKGYSMIAGFADRASISKAQVLSLLEIVGDTGEKCCIGQSMDLSMATEHTYHRGDLYIEMISLKTASLIEGALKGGAVVAGASRKQIALIGQLGLNLGLAFQIIDDSLDLLGGENTNKSIMNDLKQGKATPMIIHSLARSTPEEKDMILKAAGNRQITEGMTDAVLSIYRRYGAVDYAQQLSHQYIVKARECLRQLPHGKASERLGAILDILDYWNLSDSGKQS